MEGSRGREGARLVAAEWGPCAEAPPAFALGKSPLPAALLPLASCRFALRDAEAGGSRRSTLANNYSFEKPAGKFPQSCLFLKVPASTYFAFSQIDGNRFKL